MRNSIWVPSFSDRYVMVVKRSSNNVDPNHAQYAGRLAQFRRAGCGVRCVTISRMRGMGILG